MAAPQAKPRLVLVLTAMTLANAMILVDQTFGLAGTMRAEASREGVRWGV